MRLRVITLAFQLKKQSKQANNQGNLPTLIVSYENRSRLIRSKKKKKTEDNTKKRKIIKKLINMIMAAIIVMVIITKIKTN